MRCAAVLPISAAVACLSAGSIGDVALENAPAPGWILHRISLCDCYNRSNLFAVLPMYSETLSRADVARQLDRIVASPEFSSAPKLRAFLIYVVTRAIAGQHENIKESRIGVDVYKRQCGYDPHLDATVRVEAAKLRLRLERYYDARGRHDPVRISIPKGAYVPLIIAATARP
jgi:hypothetical protein